MRFVDSMLVGYGLSFSIVPISGGTSPKRQQTAVTVSSDKSASRKRSRPLALDSGRITGKPEVILLRRESAPVHLILRLNILGALGDT